MMTGSNASRGIGTKGALAALSALAVAGLAIAQKPDMPLPADEQPRVSFSLLGVFEYQFDSDFNEGGSYQVSRYLAGMSAQTLLLEDLKMTIGLGYELDSYDFDTGDSEFSRVADVLSMPEMMPLGANQVPDRDDPVPAGLSIDPNPWDDIHIINFGAVFSKPLDDHWTIFGGPVFQLAFESGAEIGDSFIGGALIGASYRFNDDLTLGAGFGGVSQIEDSERYFPVILVDWKIIDGLRLSNQGPTGAGGRNGIELTYSVTDRIQLGIGGAYEYRRFRLDDDEDEIAPDGVGFEERTPIWLRAGYQFNDNCSVSLYGGIAWETQIQIEDSQGQKVVDDEGDNTPFVAATLSYRF